MELLFKYLVTYSIITLVLYLNCSAFSGTFIPMKWEPQSKFMFVVLSLTINFGIIMINYLDKNINKDKTQ